MNTNSSSYSIPLYSSDVKFEIRNTNFRKAEFYGEVFEKKFDDDALKLKFDWRVPKENLENTADSIGVDGIQYSINKFYAASGIKFVLEELINKRPLEDKILNIFAEIITIASTIQEKKITSFMGVLENSDYNVFKNNVDVHFQKVIRELEIEKNLLTFKKNFFIMPEKPLAFISLKIPNEFVGRKYDFGEKSLKEKKFFAFKELEVRRTAKAVSNSTSNDCKIWLKKDIIDNRGHDKIIINAMQENESPTELEKINQKTHEKYHANFSSNKNNRSALLSIPFISSAGVYDGVEKNPKFQGYGALFVFIEFRKEIDEKYEEIVKETLEDCAKEVALNVGRFAVNYLFETAKDLYNKTQKKARQAAIAQVMLRNMSHNIGSHVLSRMVTPDTADGEQSNGQYTQIKGLNPNSNLSGSELAWFNSYLKTRMDFLADIATSVPVMEDTRMLLSEVIAGLDRNRILLNNISGVENFNYSICVKDCRANSNTSCEPLTPTNGKDIPVAMPNDILGFHALYIILENVIRNTAKHGGKTKDKIVFTVEVRQCLKDDSFYEIWLYDNYCVKKTSAEERNDVNEKDLVQQLNEKIDAEVLDSKDALRQGGWGMIEMKVSAAYLRKIAVGDVDEEKYKLSNRPDDTPHILKADSTNDCLAYVFHLMKPKQMIVVDEKGTLYDELAIATIGNKSKLELLKEHGIWVLHTEEKKIDADKFKAHSHYPHPFMLIIQNGEFRNEIYLNKDGLFKGNLPPRLLVISNPDEVERNNRWVARVEEVGALLNAIKAVRVTSEETTKADDLENSTVINLVWREWIKKKLNHLKFSGIDAEIGETYISSAFNDYVLPKAKSEKPVFFFALDHHGHNINPDEFAKGHFEAYPSLVMSTIKRCDPDVLPPLNVNPSFDKNELCKIVEGMLTKIFIIDERVQQAYESNYYPEKRVSIKKETLYKSANIHIPSKNKLDLNKSEFDKNYKECLFDEIKRISNESKFTGIDYIIIHLGVVEKILASNGQDKKEENVLSFIKDLAKCEGANGDVRIVITSGRGKPDNLPNQIPFMAYSVLSQYAIEFPFKSYITQSVSATRIVSSN